MKLQNCMAYDNYLNSYRARDSSGQTVAIKKIRIASSEEGMPMSMIREVSMLRQLENYEHENIVRYVRTQLKGLLKCFFFSNLYLILS